MQIETHGKFNWIMVTADGGFPIRDSTAVFDYSDRLWMSNGYQVGGVNVRDLYTSTDGVKWTLANDSTPYQPYSPICAFGNAIYAVDATGVWRSDDGAPFIKISATNVPENNQPEAKMLEMNGKLHIVGTMGASGNAQSCIYHYDIASSNFTSTPVPWPLRRFGASLVFNGRIYIMAGCKDGTRVPPEGSLYPIRTSVRDVWSTDNPEDPDSWVCHTDKAPWQGRFWPAVTEHAGYIYMAGGYDNFSSSQQIAFNFCDTWRTKDGENWELLETPAPFPARHAPVIYSWNGVLMMAAGNTNRGSSVQKDVWKLVAA